MQNLSNEKRFLRQCIFCKKYKAKNALIRITKDFQSGSLNINNYSKINGRSVYICKDINCIENSIKKKKIENALKSELSENIKQELYTVLRS